MSLDWAPGVGAGLLSGFLTWIFAWRVKAARDEGQLETESKYTEALRLADTQRADELRKADTLRAEDLRADLRAMRDEWREGVDKIQSLIALQGSQNRTNEMTAKTLDSLAEKLEQHQDKIADLGSTVKLLSALVMKKAE